MYFGSGERCLSGRYMLDEHLFLFILTVPLDLICVVKYIRYGNWSEIKIKEVLSSAMELNTSFGII